MWRALLFALPTLAFLACWTVALCMVVYECDGWRPVRRGFALLALAPVGVCGAGALMGGMYGLLWGH